MDRPPSEPWVATLLDIWCEGQDRSMVGPGDPVVHLRLARRLTELVPPPARALDLGSGAGIPGLALAGLWPESMWVLVDAAQRRVRLLQDAVRRLGWGGRVVVEHGRAEELGHREGLREAFPLVTSRSFGPPAVTAECGGAFVEVGGTLLVTEPPGSAGDRWPAHALEQLGLQPGVPAPGARTLTKLDPLDAKYPRRPGLPAKRPLF